MDSADASLRVTTCPAFAGMTLRMDQRQEYQCVNIKNVVTFLQHGQLRSSVQLPRQLIN